MVPGGAALVFDFALNQATFVALATGDARPLAKALRAAPPLPSTAQWATFLRNHDELDIGRLPVAQRKEVFAAFGPEPRMQLYQRGIRRRLASMLDGDRERLELAYSLMLTLPGTPVLWYGEELGMGEDLRQPDRLAVRGPMQWTSEKNAGFSTADRPLRPPLTEGPFGCERVNVARARRHPESLLNWMERMLRLRKETPELGWGRVTVLETGSPHVLALRYHWKEQGVVVVHNVGRGTCPVRLDPRPGQRVRLINVLTGDHSLPGPRGMHQLTLERYGYRWFREGVQDVAVAESLAPEP